MPTAIAVIPTDLKHTRLGLASRIADPLAGRSVLEHTIARISRVKQVRAIVLIHPADQQPQVLLAQARFAKPVHTLADPDHLTDAYLALRRAARKWALAAWRGGLGGATCYDELLPAKPILAALDEHKADSALLVGADWPLLEPDYCEQVLALNLQHLEAMKMTFTQAPPGLAGIAVARALIEQLVDSPATFGHMLNYDPKRPQGDPIGRDVCVQIPAAVRNCARRFIYDTPRSCAMIDAIAGQLGDDLAEADAPRIVESTPTSIADLAAIPQQVTLELTPKRQTCGPLMPQHHTTIRREPIDTAAAIQIVEQLGAAQDVALTLGGLGDALLHDDWDRIVLAAHDAGVLGIAIETDLLVDREAVEKLLQLPIDVVTVRLNADTAATYQQVMGSSAFKTVTGHMEWLLNTRNKCDALPLGTGVPWLVPRLIKTEHTLADMESFYNRWSHYAGHAVIESVTEGCGLMPQLGPMRMAPPRRYACRQIGHRMTIHADGQVAQCDQDWHAKAPAGHTATASLAELWQSMQPLRALHENENWNESELCAACYEWHRP